MIAPLLADEGWWVRVGARQALTTLGPNAIEHVLPYLESSDEFARNGAAEVIQNTGVADALVAKLIEEPASGAVQYALRLLVDAGGEPFGAAMFARSEDEQARVLLEAGDVSS